MNNGDGSMRTPLLFQRVLPLVFFALASSSSMGQSVPTQEETAQALAGDDRQKQLVALRAAGNIPAENIGVELRGALISALAQENARVESRMETADGSGLPASTPDDSGFYAGVVASVVRLRDVEAIPALAGALGTGMMVIRALVEFGEIAVPAVLAVAESQESRIAEVDDSLRTLRLMVDAQANHPLQVETLQRIRDVAAQRLSGRQFATTLWNASELAASLGDSVLLQTVEGFARSKPAIIERGISDPDLVAQVQARAAAAAARGRAAGHDK